MNKQTKRLIHGYLSWLLKHEQVIRTQVDHEGLYISRNVVLRYTYGLCANINSFIINRGGPLAYNFKSLNSKWPYFSGNHLYPVPHILGSKDERIAAFTYNHAVPHSVWCDGSYAEARWAYIRFLHEELSKCP